MIEDSIYEKLKTDLPSLSDRIYPTVLPSGAQLPAVTYQRIPGRRIQQHGKESPVVLGRFQFTVRSSVYETGKDIAKQIRNSLSTFQGMMGTTHQTRVDGVLLEDDRDDYDPELPMFMVYIPATVVYQEV